jgi:hypothetical protein
MGMLGWGRRDEFCKLAAQQLKMAGGPLDRVRVESLARVLGDELVQRKRPRWNGVGVEEHGRR